MERPQMIVVVALFGTLALAGCAHVVHAKSEPPPSAEAIEAIKDANYLASVMKILPHYLDDEYAAFEQSEITQVLLDLKDINSPGGNLHDQIQKLRTDTSLLVSLRVFLRRHQVL
jgi:hypothetical protein